MEKLKLYRVDINYIKYLYKFDKKVQYNPNTDNEYTERRPYLGIVLRKNSLNYFIPLEHPRIEHMKMKENIYIFKIHKGKYGILGINNMLPVPNEAIINFDINQENEKYKQILISQFRFCNKYKNEIYEKVNKTYLERIKGKNKFLIKVCCNFELLEQKCKEYIKI